MLATINNILIIYYSRFFWKNRLAFTIIFVKLFQVNFKSTCFHVTTWSKYILHVLHGHPSGTHLLILNVKALKDSSSFISFDAKSHILGCRFSALSDKIYLPSLKRIVITKVICTHFSAFIISNAMLFLTLNISVSRACLFLLWIETNLSFSTATEMKMKWIIELNYFIIKISAMKHPD